MPTADIDRYANTGEFRYLQLAGVHYRWKLGEGWSFIDETKLPENINWAPLQPKQRAVFESELPK